MSRWCLPGPGLLAVLVVTACGNETATGIGEDLLPIDPRTLEVNLAWSDFAEAVDVFGGFGLISELPGFVLAHDYQGVLEARLLSRFTGYPASVQARDTADDVVRADTMYAFLGGRLVARFDTTGQEVPVDLEVRLPAGEWDPSSATWTAMVDTLDDLRPWEEEGAGPAPLAAVGRWDPSVADSVIIELDSATVDALGDTTGLGQGIRMDAVTEDVLLNALALNLEVDVRPSIAPDTVITFRAASRSAAFIYTPLPEAPDGSELRVGGGPAWRTVIRFALSPVLDGPPDFCEQVGCPFELDPTRLSAVTLTLTTRTAPAGFQPRDTMRIDARSVLAPDRLPKAPLGSSFVGGVGVPVEPEAFGEPAGARVEIPITAFVRDLVRGETLSGGEPPDVLVLLSPGEPRTLSLASFVGPGEPGEPVLRMILTTSDTVQIR